MFHKVIVLGNLGKDPEMRYTASGTAVTNFSVATTTKISKEKKPECPEGWKDGYNGRNWELVTWFRVSCWRGLAETCNEYLRKGSQVYIEGEVNGEASSGSQNPRVWTGNDGVPRASFEITARLVKFLGGRGDSGNGGHPVEEAPPGFVEEDEIPF
jgi:single-strand DNA-binding protein